MCLSCTLGKYEDCTRSSYISVQRRVHERRLCEKIIHGATQKQSNIRQECDIGVAFLPFPFRDCLRGNAEALAKFFLRQMVVFAVLLDHFGNNNFFHIILDQPISFFISFHNSASYHFAAYGAVILVEFVNYIVDRFLIVLFFSLKLFCYFHQYDFSLFPLCR